MEPLNFRKGGGVLLPLSLLLASQTSCTSHGAQTRSSTYGLDETATCPEGFVGFNFSDTPVDTRSEYYQNRLSDAAVAPTVAGSISVQEVTCSSSSQNALDVEWNNAAFGCNGRATCSVRAPRAACGARLITYSCGAGGETSDAGTQKTQSTKGNKLDCTDAGDKLDIPTSERTLCIPRTCPVRTHRDENLLCVPDKTMPQLKSVYLSSERFAPKHPTAPRTIGASKEVTLHQDTPYTAALHMFPTKQGKSPVPESARVTYWLADIYAPKSNTGATWQSSDAITLFRCTAFDVEVKKDKTGALVANDTQLISPLCFNSTERLMTDLKRKTGLDKPEETYKRLGTRLFHSFDPHGRIAVELASAGSWGSFDDATASPCAPNPLEFFYDATTKTYDLVAYYQQRSIDENGGSHAVDNQSRAVVVTHGPPTKAHVIAEGIHLGKTSLIVGQGPVATDPLPVDVDWSMANYDTRNPLVPDNACSDKPNAWGKTFSGIQLANKEHLKQCNYAPPNLRASVYIATGTTSPAHLGDIPLSSASAEGSTETKDLRLSRAVRAKFFDSDSPLFISAKQKRRNFTVFYCIEADKPDLTIDVRPWKTRQDCKLDWSPDCDTDTVMSATTGETSWYLEVSTPTSIGNVDGCVYSKVPLVIEADRLVRPLDPVLGVAFVGDTDNTSSGDSKMSGNQLNSSEMTCTGKGEQNCTEAMGGGMASQGELGRSFFSVNTTLDREQGKSVKGDATGEMLGMQVLDMADPDSDMAEVSWPGKSSSTEQTLIIVPPWDDLYAKLRKTNSATPTQWTKGKYAGKQGLGVGIGFKYPFNIGPIPGLITVTAGVGISLEIETKLQFAPSEKDQYPCIGTERCYQRSTQDATLEAASNTCTGRGGRLAELSSQKEATQLASALSGQSGAHWIGGQMAYEYGSGICHLAYNDAMCKGSATSSYRWLSNDQQFARATGGSAATFFADTFYGTQPTLYSSLPVLSGLTHSAAGTTSLAAKSEKKPYVCVFEPASSVDYFKWSVALKLGVAASVGLSFCTPKDDIGICLGGNLNMIATSVSPTLSNEFFWLKSGGKVKRRTGKIELSIPWSVVLLEGELYAQANAYGVSATWNIVEFSGFKLKEGNLLSFEYPMQIDYE